MTRRSLSLLSHRLGIAACCLGLVACGTNLAYHEANELMAQGRSTEALARYEQAVKAEPQSAQVRIAWLRARTQSMAGWAELAQRKRDEEEFDEAEDLYRQMLQADPASEMAVQGLKITERERAWAQAVDQATLSLEQKNPEQSRALLRSVLTQNPQHARGLRLQRQLERQDAKPGVDVALGPAYRKTLSLEFKDAPLKSIFEIIAKTSGLNFVFDKDVRTDQKASLYLRNSTVEAAVNRLLISNQLAQRVLDENSVLIYSDTPAKHKDYQVLSVRTFYLSNGDAKSVAGSVKAILKVKDLVVDERLNALIVRDSPDAVRLVERMVALLDLPEPEVMLDVEVLEVKRSELLNLGVRWPEQISFSPLTSASGTQLTLSDLRKLNSSTVGVSVNPLTVSARQDSSTANILANPKIRAKSREKARILIGDRVPNITTMSTSTGFISDSVNYIDVGLKLDVEPTVFPEGDVAIKVALEVSSLVSQVQTKSGTLAYQIGTRSAATVMRLRDGENQILAGLLNDEERRSANKLPALGSAPVLSKLFGGGSDESVKTEFVLSITPRVLRNMQRPDAALLDFESGTDSGLRSRSEASTIATTNSLPSKALPAPTVTPAPANSSMTPTGGGASAVSSPGAPMPVGDVELTWDASSPVKLGQLVSVQLRAKARKPVLGLPLALGFDPTILEAVEVLEGDFLTQGGVGTLFEKRIDPSGQILATVRRVGGGGTDGSGGVLSITFRALKNTPSTVVRVLTIAPEGEGGAPVSAAHPTPLQLTITP